MQDDSLSHLFVYSFQLVNAFSSSFAVDSFSIPSMGLIITFYTVMLQALRTTLLFWCFRWIAWNHEKVSEDSDQVQ